MHLNREDGLRSSFLVLSLAWSLLTSYPNTQGANQQPHSLWNLWSPVQKLKTDSGKVDLRLFEKQHWEVCGSQP